MTRMYGSKAMLDVSTKVLVQRDRYPGPVREQTQRKTGTNRLQLVPEGEDDRDGKRWQSGRCDDLG